MGVQRLQVGTKSPAASRRNALLLACAVLIVAGASVALWLADPGKPTRDSAGPQVRAAVHQAPELIAAERRPAEPDGGAPSSGEGPSQEGAGAMIAVGPGQDPRRIEERLRLCIEESMLGALDPGEILDMALGVAALDLERQMPTETDAAGRIAYAYLGTPEGMDASLRVQRSVRTGALGLTLKMDLAGSEAPVHGFVRAGSSAEILMRVDGDGRATTFSILTESQPSGANFGQGIDPTRGQVPTGMLYHFDLTAPSDWKVAMQGLVDGQPTSWDSPVTLTGNHLDDLEKISALLELMNGSYQGLKQ